MSIFIKDYLPIATVNEIIGVDPNHISCISAKTGLNVDKLLHDIVTNIPCPEGKQDSELQALIFDSYSSYLFKVKTLNEFIKEIEMVSVIGS